MSTELAKQFTDKDGGVRRIVTGCRNGKSVVVEDAEVSAQGLFGASVIELWETIGTPILPIEGDPHGNRLLFKMPDPGCTRLRMTLIPPDDANTKRTGGHTTNASSCSARPVKDDFRMHKTKTVDYDVILSGELWMELDDGIEVHLQPGDCVIQNGTRHAWRNRSARTCTMLTVCIGAKRKR